MFHITIKGNTPKEVNDKVIDYAEYIQGKFRQDVKVDAGITETVVHTPAQTVNLPPAAPVQSPAEALVSPAQTTPGNVDVDQRGMPWDQRIHIKSKKQNKDGSWTNKRGIDKDVLAKIESELMGQAQAAPVQSLPPMPSTPTPPAAPLQAIPSAPATPTMPPVQAQAIVTPPQQVVAPVAQPAPAPVQQAAPVQPPEQNVIPGHTVESFKSQFIPTMADLLGKGLLTQETVNQFCQYFQIQEIVQASDQQIDELFNRFAEAGIINKVG